VEELRVRVRARIVAASVVPFVGYYQGLASFSLPPSWQSRLELDAVGVSLIWVSYIVGVVFSLFLSPRLAHSLGTRRVLVAGLGVGVLASLLMAFSADATATALGRFLSGITTGVSSAVGVSAALSLGTGPNAAFAVSVVTAACSLGGGIGAIGSGLLGSLSYPPDRAVYVVATVLVLIGLGMTRFTGAGRLRRRRGGTDPTGPPFPVRLVATAAVQSVCGAAPIGFFFAMGAVLFAVVSGSGDSAVVGRLAGALFGGGLVGQLLAARTADRYRRGVALTLNVGSCVLATAAMALGSAALLAVAGLAAGIGSGYSQLIVNGMLQATMEGARLSRALSWIHLAGYATNGTLPLVLGEVSDRTGGHVVSTGLLTAAVGGLAVSLCLLGRRGGRAMR